MDRADLASVKASQIVDELNQLIIDLRERAVRISSWYGQFSLAGDPQSYERINRGYDYQPLDGAADDTNFPWFLYWEIVWLVLNTSICPGRRLLDLGGSSSLFSYYMAAKGVRVTTVDLQASLVDNANDVAKRMGWDLKNHVMDMRELRFSQPFDHITSICVYEHIPLFDRVCINERIKDLLVEGGTFSITFDFANPSRLARIDTPGDVEEQFVRPSGLTLRGNPRFVDNGVRYLLHPFYHKHRRWSDKLAAIRRGEFGLSEFFAVKEANDYTFGSLFLQKHV